MIDQQQDALLLSMCAEFFADTLANAATLYWLAELAFKAAIALLIVQGVIALILLAKPIWSKDAGEVGLASAGPAGSPLDFIKALPALIDSLAKAPAPIALIAVGLLLIWVPTVDAPKVCEKPLAQSAGGPAPSNSATNPDTPPAAE